MRTTSQQRQNEKTTLEIDTPTISLVIIHKRQKAFWCLLAACAALLARHPATMIDEKQFWTKTDKKVSGWLIDQNCEENVGKSFWVNRYKKQLSVYWHCVLNNKPNLSSGYAEHIINCPHFLTPPPQQIRRSALGKKTILSDLLW